MTNRNEDESSDSSDQESPEDSPEQSADDSSDQPVAEAATVVAVLEQDHDDDAQAGEVVIGARIREAARIYHFAAPHRQVFVGDYVVVDRGRGDQLARVVTVPDDDEPRKPIPRDVRPIIRLADAEDRDSATQQAQRGDQILQEMRSEAVRQDLGLYPVAIELNLNGDRGTAWFQSPDHVDFRPMLDHIQEQYDIRLNMQQANQRERARLVDGHDICGLRLCCSSWMTEFPQVGIRVAKDQDLSLNPDSISGVCGRLLCCLTFEHEVYREMRGSLPRVGKRVSTPAGMGKVIKLNVLQQKVTIVLDDHPQRVDVPADEIGLAVRTEDAPNQALIAREQDQREDDARAAALRQAAAPAVPVETPGAPEERPSRKRRRRSRKSKSDQRDRQQPDTDQPAAQPGQSAGEPSDAVEKRPSRRRRRRKQKVVNQNQQDAPNEQSGPVQRSDSDSPKPRRRRRRSRRPVNQQDNAPPSQD